MKSQKLKKANPLYDKDIYYKIICFILMSLPYLTLLIYEAQRNITLFTIVLVSYLYISYCCYIVYKKDRKKVATLKKYNEEKNEKSKIKENPHII